MQKSAGRDASGGNKASLLEKSGSANNAPQKQQMQTIQHKSTKVNNFMAADEVTMTIMDNLIAQNKERPSSK